MIFITPTADTIQVSEFRRISPAPQYDMACASVPWFDVATPERVTFQRDGGRDEVYDSWVQTANMISLCARTDGPRWAVCYVFADGKLIGRFLRERETRRGHGPKVEEK